MSSTAAKLVRTGETMPTGTFAAVATDLRKRHPRTWMAVLAGFAVLLILIVLTGLDAVTVLGRLHSSGDQMRARFEERTRTLEQIRSGIYLSGTYVRDYLLAPEPGGASAQRGRLQALRRDTESALRQYLKDIDPGQLSDFRALRSEIDEYWRVLENTFNWTPEERNRQRYAFFYEELVPRRTAMLQVADRVASVNETELTRAEEQFSKDFNNFRMGSVITLALTLIGGLLVTGLTMMYLQRLEREAQTRLTESGRAQADLKELSAKLLRAQEEERRSISRELHDEVGQTLSAIVMETDNLLDGDHAPEVRSRLEAVHGLARRTMEETRNMSLLLRPSMLDDFGLVPALEWQARDAMRRTNLRVQLDADSAVENLPEEHTTCIYRIVQESLNNVVRHAQARAVQITLRSNGSGIDVAVQDDGSGFDTTLTRGLGLLGMEERVRHLGGEFRIESRAGRGTLVAASLPVTMVGKEQSAPKEQGNEYHPYPVS